VVPLAGIEPALLAELDFESSALYYNYMKCITLFSRLPCMCKVLCNLAAAPMSKLFKGKTCVDCAVAGGLRYGRSRPGAQVRGRRTPQPDSKAPAGAARNGKKAATLSGLESDSRL